MATIDTKKQALIQIKNVKKAFKQSDRQDLLVLDVLLFMDLVLVNLFYFQQTIMEILFSKLLVWGTVGLGLRIIFLIFKMLDTQELHFKP